MMRQEAGVACPLGCSGRHCDLSISFLGAEGVSVLRQYIVKVHSRCNLGCDYCYVYTKQDGRWKNRPAVMSESTVEALAQRMAEHLRGNSLPSIDVIFHGGEPLLIGPARLRRIVTTLRSAVDGLRFSVQTNGSLLTDRMLQELQALDIGVGVSLDGDVVAHDRHRVTAGGHGSHAAVAGGLVRLTSPRYRHLFRGLLCAIDLANDPVATYEELLQYRPPAIDFLLPHANWQHPPELPAVRAARSYGDWLVACFDRWYDAPRQETSVRIFESVVDGLFGRSSSVYGLGAGENSMVVVETDGAMEWNDTLAATYEGAAWTGLDVYRHAFAEFAALKDASAPPDGELVPTPCRPCQVRAVCGGGLPSHRYGIAGFNHRSVYCGDLLRLIHHARTRVQRDLVTLSGPA